MVLSTTFLQWQPHFRLELCTLVFTVRQFSAIFYGRQKVCPNVYQIGCSNAEHKTTLNEPTSLYLYFLNAAPCMALNIQWPLSVIYLVFQKWFKQILRHSVFAPAFLSRLQPSGQSFSAGFREWVTAVSEANVAVVEKNCAAPDQSSDLSGSVSGLM